MKAYIYDWSHEIVDNKTVVRVFCLDKHNRTIVLIVRDFLPYFYVELPDKVTTNDLDRNGCYRTSIDMIRWNRDKMEALNRHLQRKFFRNNLPVKYEIKNRKKLYYAHKNSDMQDIYFQYILYHFDTNEEFSKLRYKFNSALDVSGIGNVFLKIHEMNVSPVTQLVCTQDLKMAGWIEFEGELVKHPGTECYAEYSVSYHDCHQSSTTSNTPNPVVLSFDIEVYSSNPDVFPTGENIKVPIFLLGKGLGEHYALQAYGESMDQEGILDGDLIIIKKADSYNDGDIVVAQLHDKGATLKKFYNHGKTIELRPKSSNPMNKPIFVDW